MATHMMIPGKRDIACGENHRLVPSTRAVAVVSCQRCIAWNLGREEAGDAFGMTYDNDPESPRSIAYDNGRTFGQTMSNDTDDMPYRVGESDGWHEVASVRDGYMIVKRDARGKWRAYFREVHTSSYGGGWGRVDFAIHHRDFALRSNDTGKPLPPTRSASEQAAAIKAALADPNALMPWGSRDA